MQEHELLIRMEWHKRLLDCERQIPSLQNELADTLQRVKSKNFNCSSHDEGLYDWSSHAIAAIRQLLGRDSEITIQFDKCYQTYDLRSQFPKMAALLNQAVTQVEHDYGPLLRNFS